MPALSQLIVYYDGVNFRAEMPGKNGVRQPLLISGEDLSLTVRSALITDFQERRDAERRAELRATAERQRENIRFALSSGQMDTAFATRIWGREAVTSAKRNWELAIARAAAKYAGETAASQRQKSGKPAKPKPVPAADLTEYVDSLDALDEAAA